MDMLSISNNNNNNNFNKVKLLHNRKKIEDSSQGCIKEFKNCYELIDLASKKIGYNLLKNE